MLFQGPFHTAKKTYLGETLKCYYVLIVLANRLKWEMAMDFWNHCRDSGMIIILASSTVGSVTESLPLSFFLCVYACLWVCDKEMENSGFLSERTPPESPLILLSLSHCLFLAHVFASLRRRFLFRLVWTKAVYDGGYSTWQQVSRTVLNHSHTHTHTNTLLCSRNKYLTNCTIQLDAETMWIQAQILHRHSGLLS